MLKNPTWPGTRDYIRLRLDIASADCAKCGRKIYSGDRTTECDICGKLFCYDCSCDGDAEACCREDIWGDVRNNNYESIENCVKAGVLSAQKSGIMGADMISDDDCYEIAAESKCEVNEIIKNGWINETFYVVMQNIKSKASEYRRLSNI